MVLWTEGRGDGLEVTGRAGERKGGISCNGYHFGCGIYVQRGGVLALLQVLLLWLEGVLLGGLFSRSVFFCFFCS